MRCVCECVCGTWYGSMGPRLGQQQAVCCGDLLDREARRHVQVQIVDCHCEYRVYVLSILKHL